MADRLTIWNMALGRVSENITVDDISETSALAAACRRFYDNARDATLAEFPWGFAKRVGALTAISDPPSTGWTYLYAYPTQAIAVHSVGLLQRQAASVYPDDYFNARTVYQPYVAPNPWEQLGYTTSGGADVTCIGSDVEDAYARWTRRVTDESKFPPLFVDALAWRLALDVSTVVTRQPQFQTTAWNGFDAVIARAKAHSARERVETLPDSPAIQARL